MLATPAESGAEVQGGGHCPESRLSVSDDRRLAGFSTPNYGGFPLFGGGDAEIRFQITHKAKADCQ